VGVIITIYLFNKWCCWKILFGLHSKRVKEKGKKIWTARSGYSGEKWVPDFAVFQILTFFHRRLPANQKSYWLEIFITSSQRL
jgi:hypothetical protein